MRLAQQAEELGLPNLAAGVALPGSYVTLHLANVPTDVGTDGCDALPYIPSSSFSGLLLLWMIQPNKCAATHSVH